MIFFDYKKIKINNKNLKNLKIVYIIILYNCTTLNFAAIFLPFTKLQWGNNQNVVKQIQL